MSSTTLRRDTVGLVRDRGPIPGRYRVGGVVLLLGALAVLVAIASGPGGRWVDRPPAPNSLAGAWALSPESKVFIPSIYFVTR